MGRDDIQRQEGGDGGSSEDYQAGALSFEITSREKKLICNSGYFKNFKHQLNDISKSTASQSTLIIDNQSSCKLRKQVFHFDDSEFIKSSEKKNTL